MPRAQQLLQSVRRVGRRILDHALDQVAQRAPDDGPRPHVEDATHLPAVEREVGDAEGVKTTRVVMELAAKHDVEMPISSEVSGVLYEGRTALDAYRGLTQRTPGSEHEPN